MSSSLEASAIAVPTDDGANVAIENNNDDHNDDNDNDNDNDNDDDKNGIIQSLAPSHILEDGRFIYLPPPTLQERSKFFERSIARHGLLQDDMEDPNGEAASSPTTTAATTTATTITEEDPKDEDKTAPKIHPLAVASARLNANGLAELNRAINLAQLVTTGEYFGLTNIVDPSLESSTTGTDTNKPGGAASQPLDAVKSTFVLKRKRAQFEQASTTLERHQKRLLAAIQAQRVLDRRLFQLRQQWRLVAPEHGTRARLHAARPTEVVAIDVDVYDRDRVGGGNQALKSGQGNSSNGAGAASLSSTSIGKQQSLAGRLASRVPRFATIELQDDFKVEIDEGEDKEAAETTAAPISDPDSMEVDTTPQDGGKMDTDKQEEADDLAQFTRAEPFAVADPTLGRVMENFDPAKVPMLNLQLDIQKSSTGFLQSSCLEPVTTLSLAQGETKEYTQDEGLLVSLQHSLFCASLFESFRSELDPPPENPTQFSPVQRNLPPVAWLSCESEENFLPPPNRIVGGGFGLSPLSVVHCHEGEVKVQMDTEYTLCVKLVEANVETESKDASQDVSAGVSDRTKSGSQSPEQLHALCRALLLHAQDVYHRHSLYLRERAKKKEEEEKARGNGPRGLARITKEDAPEKARILQSCVSFGAKMLFEQRVRKVLVQTAQWLKPRSTKALVVDWLALSIFDLQSHFTLCFCNLVLDVTIARDGMTVMRMGEGDEHRKASFRSDEEFAVYLKMELRRQLRQDG